MKYFNSKAILSIIAILSGLCFWSRPAHDPDLGWHLNGGAWITEKLSNGLPLNQALPNFDFINTFNPVWHDYHWLGQIVLYRIYDAVGYTGLHIIFALFMCLVCLSLVSIYNKCSRSDSSIFALLTLLPAFYLVYDVASVRPQVISIFLIALALNRLLKKPKTTEIFYLLVIAIALVNIHVYWVFIPFLWFAFRCLPRFFNRRQAPSAIYAWFGLFVLSFAGLASPYGIYHQDPSLSNILMNYSLIWDYLNTPNYLQKTIIEFQSPMRAIGIVPLIMFLWLILVARYFTVKRFLATIELWFIGIISFILCLKAVKFIGIFAVLGLPLGIKAAKRSKLLIRLGKLATLNKFTPVVVGAFLILIAYRSYPYTNKISYSLIKALPFDACNSLAKANLQATEGRNHVRVLTHFNYGGWCRWIVYQKNINLDYRVTTDGRTQGVPASQYTKSFDIYNLQEGWDKTLDEWSPDAILASREHSLAHLLYKLPQNWKLIHQDKSFAVFIKNK
ncbi:MAG: hypothetical protein R3A13_01650 [Bdellovibrionota bacterium]